MRSDTDYLDEPRPLVSAIVVSYRTRELTLEALSSLFTCLPSECDVWLVDNASTDGVAEEALRLFPRVNVIVANENLGFGGANNLAMERARGRYFLLLNSDARLLDSQTVPCLVEHAMRDPSVGVVGPLLVDPHGRIEYSARAFPSLPKELVRRWGLYLPFRREWVGRWLLGDFWAPPSARRVDWVTGACMLVSRSAYEKVGGFDPRIFMYGEEQEWASRMREAGWRSVYEPGVAVIHQRAASGSPGQWRMRAALEADLRLVRVTAGPIRGLLFAVIRLSGFLVEASAMHLMERVKPSAYVRMRRDAAWKGFLAQAAVLARTTVRRHRPSISDRGP